MVAPKGGNEGRIQDQHDRVEYVAVEGGGARLQIDGVSHEELTYRDDREARLAASRAIERYLETLRGRAG